MRLAGIAVVAAIAVALTASGSAVGDETCNQRFTGPDSGTVNVNLTEVVTGTEIGFGLMPDGNTDAMQWDTVVFHVTGPETRDVHGDENGAAQYTPTHEGTFTVNATWTRVDCADIGRRTTTSGTSRSATFNVVHGQQPGGSYSTTKRPRNSAAHIPGDASLQARAKCPPYEIATHEPMRVDIYWTTNGRPANHSSRHVWTLGPTGCSSNRFKRSKDFLSKALNAGASGQGAFIDVFEPLKADVLAEVHSGDTLVSARRAKFRRSRTGMSVVVKRP